MSGRTGERTSSEIYPPEPISVRSARAFVCAQFANLARATLADTAALAVTELATNVVLHARTNYVVIVDEVEPGRIRVSVRDWSPAVPVVLATEPASSLGRGLRLVDQMTDAWGVERIGLDDLDGPGKVVWFELGSAGANDARAPADASYDPTVTDLLTTSAVPVDALVEVQLLGMPLQLFARETMRHRELMREMALIAMADDTQNDHVPAALTQLAGELEGYRGVGAATDAARDAAIARGD